MTATDLVLIALVLTAMAAVAAVDARRAIVDPRLMLALVCAGLLWRMFGPVETGPLWTGPAGAALGVAVVAVPIVVAQLCRRRWPLFPGDAMMLGGLGFVLGPLGLGWALLAGATLSSIYRAWLQRRRGRSFFRGYCPLGPGMMAGAMAVFVFVNAGGALAADEAEIPLPPVHPGMQDAAASRIPMPAPPPPRPGSTEAAEQSAMLAATELAPVRTPLPPKLAMRVVAVDEAVPLAFAALADRIATTAGVPVEVEERPSRVAGGAVRLPDPPRVRLAFEGALPGLLNLVTARTGYGWTWAGGAVVFYRYRDIEQPTPHGMVAPADRKTGSGERPGTGELPGAGELPSTAERPGTGQVPDTPVPDRGDRLWIVDPAHHGTLMDVLEDWGAQAGWSVVWKAARHYAVGARATLRGGFLDAADLLMAGPATRRSLVAFAHEPNRHLVIEDAGAVQ